METNDQVHDHASRHSYNQAARCPEVVFMFVFVSVRLCWCVSVLVCWSVVASVC